MLLFYRAYTAYSIRKGACLINMPGKRITIICGHYGCGKTNLTLNLALEKAQAGEKVTVVDLDIVNPYFRSSEYRALLEEKGVGLIAPVFAGTTLDTPTLPPELSSIFDESAGSVLIDAGGDDAGVTALGGLHDRLEDAGYDMLYVINRYRALSQQPEEAAALLREIEGACRLRAGGIVNNSHLGLETQMADVRNALPFAQKTAGLTGLPLLYSTVPDFAAAGGSVPEGVKIVKRLVTFAWETA